MYKQPVEKNMGQTYLIINRSSTQLTTYENEPLQFRTKFDIRLDKKHDLLNTSIYLSIYLSI